MDPNINPSAIHLAILLLIRTNTMALAKMMGTILSIVASMELVNCEMSVCFSLLQAAPCQSRAKVL